MNKTDLYLYDKVLNNDYHSGYVVQNKKTQKRGTVIGCFLGNDRTTPRYKIRRENAKSLRDTTDWKVEECVVVSAI
jgi:hypothetical protein